jgi:hypothetical protein
MSKLKVKIVYIKQILKLITLVWQIHQLFRSWVKHPATAAVVTPRAGASQICSNANKAALRQQAAYC